jgi:hypothetical protein
MLRSFVCILLLLGIGSCRASRAESATPRMSLSEAAAYLCEEEPRPSGDRRCRGFILFENGRVYRIDHLYASGEIELVRYSDHGWRRIDTPSLRVSEALKEGDEGYEMLRYRFEEQGIRR